MQTAGVATAAAGAGQVPTVCFDVLAICCVNITHGTCEEAGLVVLNGGLGVARPIALVIFWNG